MSEEEYKSLEKLISGAIEGLHETIKDFKKDTKTDLGGIRIHLQKLNGKVADHETAIEVAKVKNKVPKGLWFTITSLTTVVSVLATYLITK